MGIGADELAGHNSRKNTGWCANGFLVTPTGTPLPPPADQRRTGESIVLQTELKEPGYYTLQFFLSARRDPLAPGITYRGKAEIIWTVKGNSVRRVISVYSGTAISGAGGYVQVKLIDDSMTVFAGVNRQSYPASILLAHGTRAGTPTPPVLMDDDALVGGLRPPYTLAAGATILIPVPDDSGVNQVMILAGQAAAPSTALVSPYDVVGRWNGGYSDAWFGLDYMNRWTSVSPGMEFLQMQNRSAVNYVIRPVWGVEG